MVLILLLLVFATCPYTSKLPLPVWYQCSTVIVETTNPLKDVLNVPKSNPYKRRLPEGTDSYHQLLLDFHFLCNNVQLFFSLYPFSELLVPFPSLWGDLLQPITGQWMKDRSDLLLYLLAKLFHGNIKNKIYAIQYFH